MEEQLKERGIYEIRYRILIVNIFNTKLFCLYAREGYMTENNGLSLKIFQQFCCDGCSCKSEKEHKPEKTIEYESSGCTWDD